MKTVKLPQKNGHGRHLVNETPRGRGVPKTVTEVSADVVQMALRSRFNPIRNLTPQLLANYIDQFFLGFIAYAALAWEWIERRDDVLKNVAGKRKKDVARLEWEILTVDGADDAQANAHKEALKEFYENLEVVNALDENERGGFPLLVRQMMDATGKYYAVHEIVWKPGAVLTAEMRFVPLWFFENRTGKLQFMQIPLGGVVGQPLDEGGWMVTKGDGLMEACSVAYMFKNMPLKDWVAYSDKFGTPGILGQTNAAKGSDAGNAMRAAIANFGQNWSGVVYGAEGVIKEPISLVEAKNTSGQLPFPPLIERMDRAMSALWRGADLSSMSGSKEKNVGASVQESESNILLYDDAAMISETLNWYVDRWVLWQKFGVGMETGQKAHAYIKIIAPEDENLKLALEIDTFLLNSGAPMGYKERLEYYGRVPCADDDIPLHAPAHITERITESAAVTGEAGAKQTETLTEPGAQGSAAATITPKPATTTKRTSVAAPHTIQPLANTRVISGDADLEKFLGPHRIAFLKAFDSDLKPLRTAMESALQDSDPATQKSQLLALRQQLPAILREIVKSDRSANALSDLMKAAVKRTIDKSAFDQPMPHYAVGVKS